MRRPGSALFPWAILTALLGVCFSRLVADPTALIVDARHPSQDNANHRLTRPLGNDATFVFLPRHLQVAQRLRAFGHLPAWDPSGFAGRPMIGNPQSGLFYPPVWFAWWFSHPSALGWLTVAHLLWGGLGVYTLARSQGLRRWSATLAAGVFQASPYVLAQSFEGHYPHVWSACWFPWAFRAYYDLRSGRARGQIWLPPIVAMTALAGHLQECLLLLLTLTCWTSVDAVQKALQGRPSRALRGFITCAAAMALGLGLAAVELVPVANMLPWVHGDLLGQSGRQRNYQIEVCDLLQLLSPSALGGPADYFGPDNYWETVCSFCLVPLVLIVIGIRAGLWHVPRGERIEIRGWVLLAVASAWFASGPRLGLYSVIDSLAPGIGWFRVPARSLFLTTLAGAMLAGAGANDLLTRFDACEWRLFGTRMVKLGGALTGLLVLACLPFWPAIEKHTSRRPPLVAIGQGSAEWPGLRRETSVPPARDSGRVQHAAVRILSDPIFWSTVALLGAAIAIGCVQKPWRDRLRPAHLFVLLAIGELAVQGHSLIRVAPAGEFLAPDPISEAIGTHAADPSGAPPRVRSRDNVFPDLQAIRHGIDKTDVNDLFQLGHAAAIYEQLYAISATSPTRSRTWQPESDADSMRWIRQAVFDRMAVSFLVSDRVETDPGWPVTAMGPTGDCKLFFLHRNPTALPRAYVVPRARIVAPDAITMLREFARTDARDAVLMATDPLESTPESGRQSFTTAHWAGRDPDRPVIEVTTQAPGLLVIADTWMPGWSARVDGVPAPVFRGNHSQQVIPLKTAGIHHIDLHYKPPGFMLGSAFTVLSALLWTGLAARSLRTRDFSDPGDPLG